MRCQILLIALLLYILSISNAFSQPTAFRWHESIGDNYIGLNFSASRYFGDLNERYNIAHLQLGWSVEGHYRRRLTEQLSLRSDVGVYHVRADQRYNRRNVNYLSFSSTNSSASAGVQWDFKPVDDNLHNIIYVFATLGITKISPSTELNGRAYSLAAFQTEGKAYASWSGQITYGLGFPMALNPSTQLSFEGRYTHVLSDYVDDVSSFYVDKSGASDVEKLLADKRISQGLAPNPAGTARGNPEKNDGYFLLTLQLIRKF